MHKIKFIYLRFILMVLHNYQSYFTKVSQTKDMAKAKQIKD